MKQLIILSLTIQIGTLSELKARTRLSEFREIMNETFTQELQDETNTIIRYIIVPIMGEERGQTKIECIYPKESFIIEKIRDLKL